MTLTTRFTLSIVFIITSCLILFGGYQYFSIKNRTYLDLTNKLEADLESTREAILQPLYNYDKQTINGIIHAIMNNESLLTITVYSYAESRKTPSYGYYRNEDGTIINGVEKIIEDGMLIREAELIYYNEVIGKIVIQASVGQMNQALHQLVIGELLRIFILNVILIGSIIIIVRSKFIRPIISLTDAAQDFAKGNLSRIIPFESQDEIGQLAQSFNIMAGEIKSKVEDLSSMNQVLQQSESKYRALVDNLPQKIFIKDRDSRFVSCNRNFADNLGLAAEDIAGQNDFDFFPKKLAEKYRNDDARIMLEETTEELEEKYIENGVEITIQTVKTPIWNESGKVTGILGIFWDITEKVKARNELRESKKMLNDVLNAIPVRVFWKDVKGKYLGCNPIFAQDAGKNDPKELIGKDDFSLSSLEQAERYQKDDRAVLASGKAKVGYEKPQRTHDGDTLWLNTSKIPLRDSNGEVYGILGTYEDITHRKNAEDSLRQTLARLQAIYNTLPVIIWSLDKDGIFTLSEGQKELKAIGLEPGQVVGSSVFDLYNDNPFILEKMNLALGGEFCEYESDVNGEIYHTFLIPVFNGNSTIDGLHGLAVNITEKKRIEVELRQLRNYLSNIINSMPSALVGVDSEGRVTQWNKTVAQNSGISAEEAQGKVLSDILPAIASDMKKILHSIKSKEIIQERKRRHTVLQQSSFEDLTIYPLITNGVEGAVIRIDDVTEKARIEEMMIQSEKMLSVGGLAAGMAHEINNPLAGVLQTAKVMANRLGRKPDIPANHKAAEDLGITVDIIEAYMEARGIPRMLEAIIESSQRMSELVRNMLSFARKNDAATSTHTLEDLLDKTLELATTDYDLKKQYDFKHIKIEKEYLSHKTDVPCEASKIQQVLLNIFKNGAEAMQEAETPWPMFKIRTWYNEKQHVACMEIEDNGPGMDDATSRRIFEPFFTSKPEGVGTGLGLSVSYFIIKENHRGEMSVESSPGKGTKFLISLPLKGR